MRSRVAAFLAAATVLAVTACGSPSPEPSPETSAAPSSPSSPSAQSAPPASDTAASKDLYPGGLFLDPRSDARIAAERLKLNGATEKAEKIRKISEQPTAIWLGEWYTKTELDDVLGRYVAEAEAAGTTLVFVIYAIPNRDCGGLSAGGHRTGDDYLDWVKAIAGDLRGTGAAIIVEPDSLAMLTEPQCAGESDSRLPLIASAVEILAAAGLTPYLDAGNSNWVPEKKMAKLLRSAGVDGARGFFTNVSNFYRVDQERGYADTLSGLVGDKHFVIDVSRNGNGWKGDWCNPPGAALGQTPRVAAGTTNLDALLWVKHPGESDGDCNGGPVAGDWWERYALDLVENRPADQPE